MNKQEREYIRQEEDEMNPISFNSSTFTNPYKMAIIHHQPSYGEQEKPKEKSKAHKIFIIVLIALGIIAAISIVAYIVYAMKYLLERSSNPEILIIFWITIFLCGILMSAASSD